MISSTIDKLFFQFCHSYDDLSSIGSSQLNLFLHKCWMICLPFNRKGLLTQVDHRHGSRLRVSHILLKVYRAILCKNQGYHSECPILLPEPFHLVDCPRYQFISDIWFPLIISNCLYYFLFLADKFCEVKTSSAA